MFEKLMACFVEIKCHLLTAHFICSLSIVCSDSPRMCRINAASRPVLSLPALQQKTAGKFSFSVRSFNAEIYKFLTKMLSCTNNTLRKETLIREDNEAYKLYCFEGKKALTLYDEHLK